MIELRSFTGNRHLISTDGIMSVKEAETSSQWHGIKSIVKLKDGAVLECSDTYAEVVAKIEQQGKEFKK